jgi:hypothetical protein
MFGDRTVWRRVWRQFDLNTRDTLRLTPEDSHITRDNRLLALVGDTRDVHRVEFTYDQTADAFTVIVGKPRHRAPHWTVKATADGVDIEALRGVTVQLCEKAGVL